MIRVFIEIGMQDPFDIRYQSQTTNDGDEGTGTHKTHT